MEQINNQTSPVFEEDSNDKTSKQATNKQTNKPVPFSRKTATIKQTNQFAQGKQQQQTKKQHQFYDQTSYYFKENSLTPKQNKQTNQQINKQLW